jgi:hypothetical protein
MGLIEKVSIVSEMKVSEQFMRSKHADERLMVMADIKPNAVSPVGGVEVI